jgi:GTP-binding protein
LREKYIEYGPPNGGDGGTGGNLYIQAVRGETSLHKIARRPIMKAERGRNGEGGSRGGKRGEDLLIQVPVGTVVREIERHDPIEEYTAKQRNKGFGRDKEDDDPNAPGSDQSRKWRRDKWLLYPGALPKRFTDAWFPALPRPRKSNLAAAQPAAPVQLDLDKPMSTPMLLAAGAMGGLGNPHFTTKSIPRPKYATKGEDGLRIQLQLELKLLADVGLVGLPNAGKSTLLRALTRSRTRVGDWAFTTLSPNIGTVILDTGGGQRARTLQMADGEVRTSFSIADIPGLIEDAHLDKGLGLGFLRHIERAGVLAFVVDLSAGDAVAALKGLWREVGEYERLRERELNEETAKVTGSEHGLQTFKPFGSSVSRAFDPEPTDHKHASNSSQSPTLLKPQTGRSLPPLSLPPISSKPWFVVATKADLDGTQDNFKHLVEHLRGVQDKQVEHPSGKPNAWRQKLYGVPISAIRKEGVEGIKDICVELLGG